MPPKAALTAVRALKDKPEAVHPARHGLLWRLAKIMRTWEQRWYCLDRQGFVYSKSPQGLSLAKPVFGGGAAVQRAYAEDQVQNKAGVVLWAFTVVSDSNDGVTLYVEERAVRDQWVCSLNMAVQAYKVVQHINNRFVVDYDKPLGSGLFAVVLKGQEIATQMPVAVKVIKADAYREYKDLVDREVMVWHAVGHHPSIVRLHEVLFSSTRVYFVAELLSGGDLVTRLAEAHSYTEADVARIVRQVLQAVKHCHAQGLVHMDLKPENLVLQDKSIDSPIKLIDFSLASFFNTTTEPGGTPEFVAPELLRDPELYAEQGCGPSIDIWALGVITFYLLCGTTPFTADTLEAIIQLVKGGRWEYEPLEAWAGISTAAKDLVASMLRLDPHARPSAQQLLTHPWLTASPQQHSQAQLAHAQAAFKAQLSGKLSGKEHLRTSWINRTGVMRGGLIGCMTDMSSSNGQLNALADTPSQAALYTDTTPAAAAMPGGFVPMVGLYGQAQLNSSLQTNLYPQPVMNSSLQANHHTRARIDSGFVAHYYAQAPVNSDLLAAQMGQAGQMGQSQLDSRLQPGLTGDPGNIAYPMVAAATSAMAAAGGAGSVTLPHSGSYPAVSPHTTGQGLAGHPVLMRPQDVLAAKQGVRIGNSIDLLATANNLIPPSQQQQLLRPQQHQQQQQQAGTGGVPARQMQLLPAQANASVLGHVQDSAKTDSSQGVDSVQSKQQQLAMLQAQLESLLKLKAQREAAAVTNLQAQPPPQSQGVSVIAGSQQTHTGQGAASMQQANPDQQGANQAMVTAAQGVTGTAHQVQPAELPSQICTQQQPALQHHVAGQVQTPHAELQQQHPHVHIHTEQQQHQDVEPGLAPYAEQQQPHRGTERPSVGTTSPMMPSTIKSTGARLETEPDSMSLQPARGSSSRDAEQRMPTANATQRISNCGQAGHHQSTGDRVMPACSASSACPPATSDSTSASESTGVMLACDAVHVLHGACTPAAPDTTAAGLPTTANATSDLDSSGVAAGAAVVTVASEPPAVQAQQGLHDAATGKGVQAATGAVVDVQQSISLQAGNGIQAPKEVPAVFWMPAARSSPPAASTAGKLTSGAAQAQDQPKQHSQGKDVSAAQAGQGLALLT